MTTRQNTRRVWVHLFSGEQDGFRRKIALSTEPPKKFYIWHIVDGDTIDAATGDIRVGLSRMLATMAYELFEEVEVEEGGVMVREYRYRRHEAADKVRA